MSKVRNSKNNHGFAFQISGDVPFHDVDERPKRSGTVWTASAHIITAVFGSGVLSLAWSTAQLGWIAGPAVMLLFSVVNILHFYTSRHALSDRGSSFRQTKLHLHGCCPIQLGWVSCEIGVIQYLNLYGVAIGYTIASSISMM